MKYIKIIMSVLIVALITSCSSTQVISSYKDDKAPVKNYQKILVYGIFQQKDRAFRMETETRLAERLRSLGYNAVTAMDEYGPKAFDKVAEEDLAAKLKNSGYDAVITTALLDKKKDQYYQPGRVSYQPVGTYYNRFGRYYTTVYDRVVDPGYYATSTDYFLETNFYDISSGDLIYSAQTQSSDPSSAGDLAHDNSKQIVKDMKSKGVLSKM